jgi:hypothetical protein
MKRRFGLRPVSEDVGPCPRRRWLPYVRTEAESDFLSVFRLLENFSSFYCVLSDSILTQ